MLMAAAVLAACGSSSTPADTTSKAATPPAAATTTPAPGPNTPAASPGNAPGASAQQQGAQAFAQGLAQMAQGLQKAQTGPDGKAITPVDFEKLIECLPANPSGWERATPQGQTVSAPVANSNASADYTKGTFHVKIQITDSAFNQMLMGPLTMMAAMGYNERSSTGFKRQTTVSGQPVFEELSSPNKHAEVTAIVDKRFIVQGTGDGMDTIDPLKEITNLVDLAKISALK